MKKYIITSLLFFIPLVAGADDHCTKPNEYTIDKRCYVTEEQKTQRPYNAVVLALGVDDDGGGGNCTGTIVKEGDYYYVYTAKHCVLAKEQKKKYGFDAADEIDIMLQDNRKFRVKRSYIPFGEDLAIYRFYDADKSAIEKNAIAKTNKTNNPSPNPDLDYPGYAGVRVVGHGILKIMSDKEISDFKKAYEEYLLKQGKRIEGDRDGLYVNLDILNEKWPDLTNDYYNLKESVCDYYIIYGTYDCQGWKGNSGGPILDSDGNIMAVATHGNLVIGGERHARIANTRGSSVSLLKEEADKK